MKKKTIAVLITIAIVASVVMFVGCVKKQPTLTYQEFNRWGITFEYPKEWQEWSAEKTLAVKRFLAAELAKIPMGAPGEPIKRC